MNRNRHSRFDCLWDGTILWFLAVYCGSGAYSMLTSSPAGQSFDRSAAWLLAALAVMLGLFALGEYRGAIFGPRRLS